MVAGISASIAVEVKMVVGGMVLGSLELVSEALVDLATRIVEVKRTTN